MIICVTSVFNFSAFTLIKGCLMLVSANVDGNMVKCCVWPKVKSVIYLQLSHIFVTWRTIFINHFMMVILSSRFV
jgi:hypothetical protein